MSIQALREERAAKAKALNELAHKADWNAEVDAPIYDAAMDEIDAIDAKIERINKANAKAAEQALITHVAERAERAGVDNKSDGARLYAKWLRGGDKAFNAADWQIYNTMSVGGAGSEGGYTVATDVATSVLDALKAFGAMRPNAEVIQTTGGNPMTFPTSDGTAEEGEWVAENTAATDLDISFGTKSLPVYKASSKTVTVPFELLQDSNVDIEAFVRSRLVTRLGRTTDKGFTVGSGTAQPNGIVTAAGLGFTAASATAIAYDDLVELEHSVDPAYRAGNVAFMFHDSTLKAIKKLKDSQGRPLWVPGVALREPDTILGYRYVVNQYMDTIATTKKTVIFGDLSKYVIRDVMSVEMFRFTDSAYTKKGQVGFLAWMRSGGNLMDVGGAVKYLAQA